VNRFKGVLLLSGRFVSLDCQQVALVGLFLIDVICLSWGSFVSLLKIPTNETGLFCGSLFRLTSLFCGSFF